ncbi:hypothetical protein F2Q70_00033711 [Brassica cretica]|uniref:Uncharacterized protein n=2 Tax=Brassica cretica TaxID=69181 RepID=A0A8S9JUC3_BRACR|nr:hypothetical protein F2Q68_00028575 [Brassica cretica]KAF2585087.1 hypothetical protein F2Q70_00033711 [Brassica cretica]KAF3534399.1 hypothetical protein DY000_02036190 [Brassica cretica]
MEVIDFSETEMEAAEQLVQLSEDDTLSCSSGTGLSVSGCEGGGVHTKRHDDVFSSETREETSDGVVRMMNNNATDAQRFVKAIMETNIIRRRYKKKKFRSLASLYRATKEMTTD